MERCKQWSYAHPAVARGNKVVCSVIAHTLQSSAESRLATLGLSLVHTTQPRLSGTSAATATALLPRHLAPDQPGPTSVQQMFNNKANEANARWMPWVA